MFWQCWRKRIALGRTASEQAATRKHKALIDGLTDQAEWGGGSERGTMESLLDIFEPEELVQLGYGERVKAYFEEYGGDRDWENISRRRSMKLCEHCVRGVQSREPLFVGPMVLSAEESEEENTPCEWCGEFDDLYNCRFEETQS